MKTKLFLAAAVFAVFTTKAQLLTIDENFNSFTTGTNAIPQKDWNKVTASATYNVYVAANNGSNAIQFYTANAAGIGAPSYLISPQIVTPDGSKKIQFTTAASSGNNGGATIEVGLVSSITDMSTFQSLGSPVVLATSSTTPQTFTFDVPVSSSQYIAWKFIGDANHSAVYVDNVKYDKMAGTINENFDNFTAGTSAIPQNDWNKVTDNAAYNVYVAANNGSNAIQFYAANKANATAYLISPQIVTPDGNKKIQFTTAVSSGNNGGSTIQVGLVSSITDMTTFQSLGNPVVLTTSSTTPQTFTFDVPASTSQYIAWKFIGDATHSAAYIDNVKYDTAGFLSVNSNVKAGNAIRFGISNNNEIIFVGQTTVKSIKIYSASGNLTAQGNVRNNTFDISALKSGVYIFVAEDNNRNVINSKFIKK